MTSASPEKMQSTKRVLAILVQGMFLLVALPIAWAFLYPLLKPSADGTPPPPAVVAIQKKITATKPESNVADRAERYLKKKNVTPLSGSLLTLLANPTSFLVKTQDHALLGKHCSDFTLKDHEDKDWSLGDALEKKPIVLIFYQGYECDHCVAQLFGINKDVEKFREMDAQIVAISPDKPSHTRKQYAKFGKFAFPVLSDPDKKVAEQFGVYELPDPNGAGTFYHATIVIDPDGVVRWVNKDFEPFVNNRTLLYEVAKLTGRLPTQ